MGKPNKQWGSGDRVGGGAASTCLRSRSGLCGNAQKITIKREKKKKTILFFSWFEGTVHSNLLTNMPMESRITLQHSPK